MMIFYVYAFFVDDSLHEMICLFRIHHEMTQALNTKIISSFLFVKEKKNETNLV